MEAEASRGQGRRVAYRYDPENKSPGTLVPAAFATAAFHRNQRVPRNP